MAANTHHPVTFGATIGGLDAPQQTLRSPPSNDSTISTTTNEKDTGLDSSNPFSAFYKHPDARRSMDALPQSNTHLDVNFNVYDRDLEPGVPLSAATTQQPKVSVDGRVKECTMWPSRQAIMEKKKLSQRAKGCSFFHRLSNKQRLWAKIVIALFLVAAAAGTGVGISKAVGGGVWKKPGEHGPIQ
ncbi:hypothetical protein P171DRAFT_95553 [Karstenula rhodostoma CBS 690.94]|uniref:Uncharacterized protein n=1 Tax=Karstenula rhodostoma CBS 690.94 TaxID=1392251 RepID=A0A9P4PDU1_9PLEO|nr:hypothetical protein P171DRAFT_95553 [Karstenula rhodostoma CBS 690.94]